MDDQSNESPSLSVRIWLCGLFHIEWIDPVTGHAFAPSKEKLREKDGTQALSLLKLLLCQPGRQAHRDWVMEQFWPEQAQSVASHRLHNITSTFRKLLCPPDGLPLLPPISGKKDSSSIYALPAYPRLWVDSDAIVWNIEQAARMERFGDDALPFWQRAFDLLKRGPFLLDEPYAIWAQAKRTALEGYYRQCVHALSRLYLTRSGDAGKSEALLLLRTYWQQHPTDEDALRPLMELLGEQGRFQEAEACYQQCCHAHTELGLSLDELSRTLDPRTQDLRAYLRTKHMQRTSKMAVTGSTIEIPHSTSALSSKRLLTPNADLAPVIAQDIIKTIRELLGVEGTTTLQFSEMIHRRAVLAHLFGLPPALLAADTSQVDPIAGAMKLQEEALSSLYEDMLIMGWDSFRRSKSPQIIARIDEHVKKLSAFTSIAELSERDHWQSLLCRFSQLATRIAQHRLDEARALQMAKQAITLAIDLDNAELIASTFYSRARVYMEYTSTANEGEQKKHYFERAKADIDAALGYVERVRPPLAGNIYLLAAEIYALIAGSDGVLRTQCEKWQDQVALLVESELEDDGTFLKLNPTALHHERAKTLLRFGRIEDARREMTAAWKILQPNLFTWHMNMHLTQASVFLAEKDLEESAKSGLKAHALAKTIHSHKGEVEVQRLLECLYPLDQANSSVQELAITIRSHA
jgi:DNA-binding SARP family transcriptional activator